MLKHVTNPLIIVPLQPTFSIHQSSLIYTAMATDSTPTRLNPFQSFARNFFDEVKHHIEKGYAFDNEHKSDLEIFESVVGIDTKTKSYLYPQWENHLPDHPDENHQLDFERRVYEAMMIWDMIRAQRQKNEKDGMFDCASFGIESLMTVADGKRRFLNSADPTSDPSGSKKTERMGQLSLNEHIIESIGEIFNLRKTAYIESGREKESCLNTMQWRLSKLNNGDIGSKNVHNMAYHCRMTRNKIHEKQIKLDSSISNLLVRNYISIIYILRNYYNSAFSEENVSKFSKEFYSFYQGNKEKYRIPVYIPNNADNPIGTTEFGGWKELKPDRNGVFWLEPYKEVYAFQKYGTSPFYVEARDCYAQITPPSQKRHTTIIDYFDVETDNAQLHEKIEGLKKEFGAQLKAITIDLNNKIAAGASSEAINNIIGRLDKLEEAAKEFRKSFNKDPEVEKNTQRINQLKSDFGKEIKAINDKLVNLDGRVTEVEGKVEEQGEAINKVKGKVEDLEGKVEGQGNDITTLKEAEKHRKQAEKHRKLIRWGAVAAVVVVLLGVCAWQAEAITTWWNPDYPYQKAIEAEQQAVARLQGVDLANYDYARDGETRALVQRSAQMYQKAIKAYEGICADDTVKHAERIKRLALMHMTGKGGNIDYARATHWAKKLSRNDGAGLLAMLASMSWTPEDATTLLLRQKSDNQPLDDWGKLCQTMYTLLTDSAGSIHAFADLQALAKSQDPYLQQMASHQLAKLYKSGYLDVDGKWNASWGKCDSIQASLVRSLHLPAVHTLFDTYHTDIAGGQGFNDLTVNLALMSKDLGDRELHIPLLDLSKRHNQLNGERYIPLQDSIDVANWSMDDAQANTHLNDAQLLHNNGMDDQALMSMDKAFQNFTPANAMQFMLMPQGMIRSLLQKGSSQAVLKYLQDQAPDGLAYTEQDRQAITDYLDGLCYANGLNNKPVDHARADSLLLQAANYGLNAAAMAYAAHSLRDFQVPDNELTINTIRTMNEKGMRILEKPMPFSSCSTLSPSEASRLKGWIGTIASEGYSDAESMMAFLCKESYDPKFLHWHQKALEHYQIGAVVYEITARWNDFAALAPDQVQEGIRLLEVALAGNHFVHKKECIRAIEALAELKAIAGENVDPYLNLRLCNFGKIFTDEDKQLYNAFLHRLAYAYWLGKNNACVDAYVAYAIYSLEKSNFSKKDLRFIYAESELFFPGALAIIENATGRTGLFAEAHQELQGKDKREAIINYTEPYDRSYPLPPPIHYTLQ